MNARPRGVNSRDDRVDSQVRRSKLHLVDLAGSERAAKTGIDGTTLREAKFINLSLHYLEQLGAPRSVQPRSSSSSPERGRISRALFNRNQ